ncbi:AAA family ATPase [Brevibacillus sp. AY1]|uniref:AAA family ATPase n=1 Tax=Brevibacillus sp. AY1 TaxID=2807621 RepID=UPI002458FE0A|nr:AAA family ATPase [Brevibacillus sp. AY1]MDH4616690.1 AAA family ATPase [Brevibacillus sp. AY1]
MTKIDILKAMIARDQTNALAWFLLGLEYAERGKRNEALHAFTQALTHGDEEIRQKIVNERSQVLEETPLKKAIEDTDFFLAYESIPTLVTEGSSASVEEKGEDQEVSPVYLSDIGGMDAVKKAIQNKIIQPFQTMGHSGIFRKKGGGSSVLLYGPPGCGKSLFAKAIAGECQARFLHLPITESLSPYQGVNDAHIKELFDSAREQMPALLFFDELDALSNNRGKSSSLMLRRVIDQILWEIDQIKANADKILIVGATSMPWDVDPSCQRPGRFDKMIFVSPPDKEAREAIFRSKLAGRPSEPLDFSQLAAWTNLYSASDIEYVVELATEQVLHDILTKGIERPIQMSDLRESIAATRSTTIEWLRTMKSYIKYANEDGFYDDVECYLRRQKRL